MLRKQLSLNEYHHVMIACEQNWVEPGLNVGYSTWVELTFECPSENNVRCTWLQAATDTEIFSI